MHPRPSMTTFSSDGVSLAYLDVPSEGTERGTVLLIHGFASNAATNWVDTGWVADFARAGYRVVALDNRGHGNSEKLYELEDYGAPLMAEDVRRLLDHLAIPGAHVIGYSMGARIAAFLAIAHPGRVQSLVFGGLGINMVRGMVGSGPLAKALEEDSIDHVSNDTARSFRAFAEQTKSDLKALAACMRGPREKITPEQLATIQIPVLIAVGTNDVIGGSGAELAKLIRGAQFLEIEGRDHMKAVGDAKFKQGVLDFLTKRA